MWALDSLKTHLTDGPPPGLEPALLAFAVKTFRPAAPTLPVPCNQGLQRAAGLAYAAKLFPAAPAALRRSWQAYATKIWALVAGNGDLTEDAPNYNRIDATFFWLLSDLLGEQARAEAARPHFHAMYVRFRDQVGPAGCVPAYGDSGGANNPNSTSVTGAKIDVPNW